MQIIWRVSRHEGICFGLRFWIWFLVLCLCSVISANMKKSIDSVFITNISFLLPIIWSFYKNEWIYFILSCSICATSTFFHYAEISKKIYVIRVQVFDRILSVICYTYMFYFAFYFLEWRYSILAYISLIFSLMIYILSKMKSRRFHERFWHTIFHITIGTVAALIVLLS